MSSNAKKNREWAEKKAAEAQKKALEAKEAAKAEKKEKLKKKKPLIITGVALLLVAAILVTGYFVWYKPEKEKPTFTNGKSSLTAIENTYTYEKGTYNGYAVPTDCVEILTQADADCKKAASKYGVAMTVGETEISVPEFGMFYFDMFSGILSGYETDPSGATLKSDSMPVDQTYANTQYTWQDELAALSRNKIQELLVQYRAALDAGVMLTDAELEEWTSQKTAIESMAKNSNISTDESVQNTYCEGVTFPMYLKYVLVRLYAYEYKLQLTAQYKKDLTPAKIKELYQKDPMAYLYADVHIFTVGSTDVLTEEDIASIHDLDSFLDFAGSYYKTEQRGYDRETAVYDTRWQRVTRSTLAQKMGGDLVDWVFSADRKDGEVVVVNSNLYQCVVYLDRAPYDSHSVDVQQATLYYNADTLTTSPTEAEKSAFDDDRATLKMQWDASDKSADSFAVIAQEFSGDEFAQTGGYNTGVRRGDVDRNTVEWLFDEDRKPGEYKILDIAAGCIMYYITANNAEDKDSEYYVTLAYLNEMITADVDNMKNGEAAYLKVNDGKMKKAITYGDESVERYLTQMGTLKTDEETTTK